MPTLKIEINISLSGKGKDMIEIQEIFTNRQSVYKNENISEEERKQNEFERVPCEHERFS